MNGELTGATRRPSCVNCAVDGPERCVQGRGARYRCPNSATGSNNVNDNRDAPRRSHEPRAASFRDSNFHDDSELARAFFLTPWPMRSKCSSPCFE